MQRTVLSLKISTSLMNIRIALVAVFVFLLGVGLSAQNPPPVFSKAFGPGTIGPGSTSTLVFTIDNSSSTNPAIDLAFTDGLPAGVTIAADPAAASTCLDGSVSAPAGGSTITYSGGRVGGGNSCTVSVNVTSIR